MAITYPLNLPTHTGIASIELHAINAVAYSQSPFTFEGQVHAHAGEMWTADVSLPPMKRADAEQWIAFLMSLRGQYGTFRLSDPTAAEPRGTATGMTITGGTGDRTINATVTSGRTLKAGDYFGIVSGGKYRLHKILVDYVGTSSPASMEIWPALRDSYTNLNVDLSAPQGQFRLASSDTNWSVNDASFYGITFGAIEAI
jgi:hypothetical protein